MASGLNKHHILEAIDKLRSRKSRPDVLRIVSYVSKKYEFPKNDIKEYLEMLSKDGTVLKVEFKGSISYRNAANYRNVMPKTLTSMNQETCNNQESISDLVAEALAQLIVQEPDYLDVGISMNELYNHIDGRHKKTLTKNYFKEILQKEVKNGNLVKFDNGNYCLGYPNGEQSSLSSSVSETSQISNDKSKEKSKSPVSTIRKFASLSRHPSPSSSRNNGTSSLILSDKGLKASKPPPHSRTYMKAIKKSQVKTHFYESKVDGCDKNEMSPVRESSRRKRFQKIVFDPSDNPKPKRAKEKETIVLLHSKKVRGPYNKRGIKENDGSSEKSAKKETPVCVSKQQTKAAVSAKPEESERKADGVSEEESEQEVPSSNGNSCKICLFNIDFKSNRASERWLSCQLCEKKAHVSCVEDTEHWTGFKLSKWQCNDCKSCVACKGSKNSNDVGLILCGLCDDAYHIKCANIKKSKTTQKWFCAKCSGAFNDDIKIEKEEFESTEPTSNESSQRTTPEPEEKKVPEKEGSRKVRKNSRDSEEIDETIPDCTNWSCEEVYSYFSKYVLPEEADIFRDQVFPLEKLSEIFQLSMKVYRAGKDEEVGFVQVNEKYMSLVVEFLYLFIKEPDMTMRSIGRSLYLYHQKMFTDEIDGRVLLLLTRYDVLSDFKLKLGPALKIYAQVKRLQVRKNDPYLYWP